MAGRRSAGDWGRSAGRGRGVDGRRDDDGGCSDDGGLRDGSALFLNASLRLVVVLTFNCKLRGTEDDRRRGPRLSVDLHPLLSTPG